MKRKHTGYMNPLIRFWNWYLQKKVQSGTTGPRHQGLRRCRASVTQWGLVDGYLSSTLVPLLSRATADQPVAAKCTGALHPTVLQFSWGWLSSPTYSMLPCTHVLSCAHVLSSPLPTDHLPARAHISTYEAPKARLKQIASQIGCWGANRRAQDCFCICSIVPHLGHDEGRGRPSPRCARINNCKQSLGEWRP